jgi:two-component system OmpR family sensor kinase
VSLRARLVVMVLVVLAAGLFASAVGTATLLRSYMLDRVDAQLRGTSGFAARAMSINPPPLNSTRGFSPGVTTERPPADVPDVQAARVDRTGHVVRTLQGPFSEATNAFSNLPRAPLDRARRGAIVEFETSTRTGRYRGVAQRIRGTTDVAVVITPLHNLEATLSRLYWIEAVGTAVLLAVAGVVALVLVRIGLRALRHMADTADAVASGAVERRVDVSGGNEVSRLGLALNAAFDARVASEAALRRFVSDASHELRTPLTTIRGYAQLLDAGAVSEPDDVKQAVERIEHEGERMSELVDELLVLARLDEARPLVLSDVDLTVLAADAVNDARAVEPDRPITLVAPRPVRVIGDETSLRQVFANLLGNVRQHTAPGTAVEVRVDATRDGARLDVIDDGPGIDAADREHVFERFWHAARRPGNNGAAGSGLGLAIVAAVAAAHGGWAYVDEHAERGAHFVVTVPSTPPA